MLTKRYRPSAGDKAYVAFMRDRSAAHPLDQALAIRRVSDAYLADLARSNVGPESASIRALIDIELGRRNSAPARRANAIALAAALISLVALFVSIFARR